MWDIRMNKSKIILVFFFIIGSGSFCSILTKPLVSIITSVYKGDDFIQGFMEDITRQTIFDQCELIIINANSPQNEEFIIQQYIEKYPNNIRYIKLTSDPGLYSVWNKAIELTQSEFITNANIDDRLSPYCYEKHLNYLIDNPHVDLVYSDYYISCQPNETFENATSNKFRELPEFSINALTTYCLPNNHPMWRKTLHTKYGLFDETFKIAGDYEMWIRAALQGSIFKKVPEILGVFYHNPGGLSMNKDTAKILATEKKCLSERYNLKKKRLF